MSFDGTDDDTSFKDTSIWVSAINSDEFLGFDEDFSDFEDYNFCYLQNTKFPYCILVYVLL